MLFKTSEDKFDMTNLADRAGSADKPSAKLRCRNLWKIYGHRPTKALDTALSSTEPAAALKRRLEASGHFLALADVSFEVQQGEIFVVMGLSGSGKSTLVRCLSRLVEPTNGEVWLGKENLLAASERRMVEVRRKVMGMVFQSFGLLPHLNALDNVTFPLRMQGMPPAERIRKGEEMIALVGLQGRERSMPHELSGGQQQRVGIARSLAVGPELWFLDEPFSALDPLIRRQMQDEFLRLQRLLQKTIVFITHDIQEAFRLADRIAIMREGRIIQIGTPAQIMLHPVDSYVASFTEEISLTKVVTAGSVMEAIPGNWNAGEGAHQIDEWMPIEALLPQSIAGTRSFVITREGKGPVGLLTSEVIAKVLAKDTTQRGAT
ncbi:quaternary amine ABC transporter ATP-binding protein [Mesorhizobium sp. B1-1-8]|uniref:quaternary amine ABC transporter ATP-binding protein n=1 Tax=Mesorhizobium sp. B1-1-8 TaxID=2589976 RepID=UPI001D022353|nr:ATP-binding cassette domain-containing protein [Mesorhizobium sp. B1-1-8]UCI10441.1 ATP-binding cassette domain-containing protein [Mesorhizobium sp. B1-1-8]